MKTLMKISLAVFTGVVAAGVFALAGAAETAASGSSKLILSGDQEVPKVSTAASGSGTIVVNADKSVSGSIMTMVIAGKVTLEGELSLPQSSRGVVIFAHGSGSGRHSPRNQYVARMLRASGMGTLLLDLLTLQEENVDIHTRHLRFDIDLLAGRLVN